MMDNTREEITVDEIVKKIREEVALKRNAVPIEDQREDSELDISEHDIFPPEVTETPLWRVLKKIQFKLQNYPFYRMLHRIALRVKKFIPKYRHRHLSVGDLSKYHDEQFINNAYQNILRREPDPQGLNQYLIKLRSGQLNKTEILGRLRYSSEGRKQGVKIKSLLLSFSANIAYRIPVAGYVLHLLSALFRFPAILKGIQEREADTQARFTQFSKAIREHERTNERQIETIWKNKADRQNIQELETHIHGLEGQAEIITKQIHHHNLEILEQQRRLAALLDEARKRFTEPVLSEQVHAMLKEDDHLLDGMYLAFEDRFRGKREDVKDRFKVYLPYIQRAKAGTNEAPVLDAGCGRGEWLDLLKENGFIAKGIDSNKVMLNICRQLGLDVVDADVVEYLRRQNSNSLGAVTGFHIAEHLPFKSLIALLDESLRILKPGGIAILETPNPENLIVGACNFYLDMTHQRPIPPLALQYIAESRGFDNVEILRLHKSEQYRFDDEALQALLAGEQDYAVIGQKV